MTLNRTKLIFVILFQTVILSGQKDFSFVYLPDIHLQPDSASVSGFGQMVRQVNSYKPDFILTGGDMIYTAKNVNDIKAEVLFDLMDKEFKLFRMPVYMTMGNHENVGITIESGIDKSNPNWGKQMFEKRYGKRYYTFNYNGWKFFVLDGIRILEKEKNYTQGIDSAQITWIKNELASVPAETPLVISIHTPVVNPHALTSSTLKVMSPEIEALMALFKDRNLCLVLEGHTHLYMSLLYGGIDYLSGGSTEITTDPMNHGFFFIKVKGKNIDPEFIKLDKSNHRLKK